MSELTQRLARSVLSRTCGAESGKRLAILIYHRVLDQADEYRRSLPTAEIFSWQMELLSNHMTPLSLSDGLSLMAENKLPARAVCVTFDDGYADNERIALPILLKYAIPATVFVTTGVLNGGVMWNDSVIDSIKDYPGESIDLTPISVGRLPLNTVGDKRAAILETIRCLKHRPYKQRIEAVDYLAGLARTSVADLMLTDRQLQNLHNKGIEIGGHTISHPILSKLDDAAALEEILGNKRMLEGLLDTELRYFAYPNGVSGQDYDQRHVNMVRRAGYEAAVSTNWGVNSLQSDRWQLTRFTPWDRSPTRFLIRLLQSYRNLS